MNINLKNWTGTVLVAVLAGFVIFGLLRGQEILSRFLKSEPTDANLERGELLEQVLSPSPVLTKIPVATKISTPSPTPILRLIPVSTLTPSPTPNTILTFTPTSSPIPTQALTPTPTPTPTPQSTAIPQPQPTSGAEPSTSNKININTADKAELEKITGVGPVIAQRIIDYRNTYGPFQKIEDIKEVNGIGDKNFEKMKDEITVGD